MNEIINNIISECGGFAEIADSAYMNKCISWTKEELEKEHIPTAVLTQNGNVSTALSFACGLLGDNGLMKLDHYLQDIPLCLTFEYAPKEALYLATAEGVEEITLDAIPAINEGVELIFAFPCNTLKNMRLILVVNKYNSDIWRAIVDEADAICLRTNATMAMSLDEKQWVKNVINERFGTDNFAVWIDNLNILNNDEELNGVLEGVKLALQILNVNSPCLKSAKEAADFIMSLENDSLVATREKRIVLNLLKDCSKEIEKLLAINIEEPDKIQKAVADLEASGKRLEISGQISARTIYSNELNRLENSVQESTRDYINQMKNNITDKINKSPDDKLEELSQQIERYVNRVLEYYITEISDSVNKDLQDIYEKVFLQMEMDTEALYAQLDDGTVNIIRSSFKNSITPNGILFEGISKPISNDGFEEYNSIDALKKQTKSTLLIGIPLAFVNPFVGITVIAGSGIVGGMSIKNAEKEYRNELINQVSVICGNSLSALSDSIEKGFNSAKEESVKRITNAYKDIINVLIKQIKDLAEQQKMIEAQRDKLEVINKVTIPELSGKL